MTHARDTAPFLTDLADGPPDGQVEWLHAADGVRLRAAFWAGTGMRGTVFLLPGRTECVEKYGRAACDLAARGYGTITIDWRGQGLADRAARDRLLGHVTDMAEYQTDLDALMALARARGLPEPWFLIGHSMGGAIGLRALVRGLPFRAAAFSAPMWGIKISPWLRPAAHVLSRLSGSLGIAQTYAPSTGPLCYVTTAPFAGNLLTRDADMWEYMRAQLLAEPALCLGGPSLAWLNAALVECAALARAPRPRLPVTVALGTAERIVDIPSVEAMVTNWPSARLERFLDAEHEILMGTPAQRARFFDGAAALFAAQI